MTDEKMALLELVEKGADADLVRDMLAFAADRIMEAEAEVAAGAAKGARSPLREVYRNGYREQDWDVRFVDIVSTASVGCGLDGQRCALPTIPQPQQQQADCRRSRKKKPSVPCGGAGHGSRPIGSSAMRARSADGSASRARRCASGCGDMTPMAMLGWRSAAGGHASRRLRRLGRARPS